MNERLDVSGLPAEKTLQDYFAALGRRWKLGAAAFVTVLSAAVVAAVLWPSTYRSTATILIEQQQIPEDLVRTTITSFADQRIELISQRVMTTTNLLTIIRNHNLYADDFDRLPREAIVERMRNDISRDMISAEVIDPRSGRPTEATIAFTVGFDSRSPVLAARVATELTSLYLQENAQTRREQTAQASSFLAGEAARLSVEIAELETRLAEFKQANVNQLPELANLNLQLHQRTEAEIDDIRRQRGVLEERKIYLESELAQLNPSRPFVDSNGDLVLSPRERLRALQAQLSGMQGIYSERHPAVVRTQRAIRSLETELGIEAQRSPREIRLEVAELGAERETLIERYTDTHPEVARVDRQLEALRVELAATESGSGGAMSTAGAAGGAAAGREIADNPAYVQLRAQLDTADLELAALAGQETEATARLAELERRLAQTPIIERDYYSLTRDLDTARARYQEVRFGERSAQTAENLELDAKGERFTLIEPPAQPEQPVSPNRPAIVFLGMFLAFAIAVALMAVREVLDTSVHGPAELVAITGAAPIGVIPRIVTEEDRRIARRRLTYATAGAALAFLVLLGAAHFFVMPLDELWLRALRRVGA